MSRSQIEPLQTTALISVSVKDCLTAFEDVIRTIDDGRSEEIFGPILTPWLDELGRFRVWLANIGAIQTGRSSLDYRLRDDSTIHDQFRELLDSLCKHLRATQHYLLQRGDSAYDTPQETFADDDNPQIERLHSFVVGNIRNLLQLSMLVRRPLRGDFLRGGNSAEAKAFFPLDVDNLRTKYPKAEDFLIYRLATASTNRRRYLLYRQRHRAKLGRDVDDTPELTAEALSDTIATSLEKNPQVEDDVASMEAMSETSFATSWLEGSNLSMPRRPQEAAGGAPFECPYCFYIIVASARRSWVKHVFDDLRPYMCTVKDCSHDYVHFESRHEWIHHLKKSHGQAFAHECPLCQVALKGEQAWISHVAHHLQEIALFVLPSYEDKSEDGGSSDPSVATGTGNESSSEEEEVPRRSVGTRNLMRLEQEDVTYTRPPPPMAPFISAKWSLKEHAQFNLGVRDLGTDWDGIAAQITSKTAEIVSIILW